MPELCNLSVLESLRYFGRSENRCGRRTDFWTAAMIWLNMASTLSDWCWLGARWWDWADIMGVEMGHVEGREEVNVAAG